MVRTPLHRRGSGKQVSQMLHQLKRNLATYCEVGKTDEGPTPDLYEMALDPEITLGSGIISALPNLKIGRNRRIYMPWEKATPTAEEIKNFELVSVYMSAAWELQGAVWRIRTNVRNGKKGLIPVQYDDLCYLMMNHAVPEGMRRVDVSGRKYRVNPSYAAQEREFLDVGA